MATMVKERKRSGQLDADSESIQSVATLFKLGMKDCTPGSFKARAMEFQDLESLYRLKHVAYDTFISDRFVLADVMRIIDQRINSL